MASINRDRAYSEKEVRHIINRAISHQEADRQETDEGLSIDEIERLAQEVGIDAKYVLMAVAEMQRPSKKSVKNSSVLGGPTKVEFERTFDGTLTDETIAELAREIRATFKQQRGNLEVIGASFEWSSSLHTSHDLYIEGQSSEGQTRLYIRQKFDAWAVLSYFWLVFPMLLFFPILIEVGWTGALSALVTFMVMALAGRFAYSRSTHRRTEKLTDLLGRLESIATQNRKTVTEATDTNTSEMLNSPASPRINLDVDSAQEPAPMTQRQRRRSR